jgi:hypothetical protein
MLFPDPTPDGSKPVSSSKLSQMSPAAVASTAVVAEDPPSPENLRVPKESELIDTE